MLVIKKENSNIFNAYLQKPLALFDKDSAQKLKKEVKKLINENRTVNIKLDLVDEFDGNSYKILGELIKLAEKKDCTINLTVDGIDIISRMNQDID